MGKRKRNNEAHDGQEESNLKGKNGAKEKNGVTGQSTEKKGGQSGGKTVFSWTSAQVIVVLKELVKLAKENTSRPLDNSSINWEQLAVAVGERLDHSFTRTQIYEKARRLKERYVRNLENVSCGKLSFLENKDDEKMFKLSHKVWGVGKPPELKPDEEEHDLPSGNLESDSNEAQSHGSLLHDAEVQKTQKERTSKDLKRGRSRSNKPEQRLDVSVNTSRDEDIIDAVNTSYEEDLNNAGNGSQEQTEPDVKIASQLNINGSEGDITRTIEVFHSEHQALLKDVQTSCTTVLQEMEAKFLSVLSTLRGSRSSWMGVGLPSSPVDLMSQDLVSWDKRADRSLSSTGGNQTAAFENLAREWQQQHLQELKLTSLKLQLMLDECKREKEKLEKQVLKS